MSIIIDAITPEFTPEQMSPGSSGVDLKAFIGCMAVIQPGDRVRVRTGVKVSIPEGFEGQIRSRSGLASRHGITVMNAPGTIDSDFRGEIEVLLINLSTSQYVINRGDRIAQLIFAPVVKASIGYRVRDEDRGVGSFGSTGR